MEGDGFFCICLLLWGEGYPFAGVAEEGGFPRDLRKRKGRRRGVFVSNLEIERESIRLQEKTSGRYSVVWGVGSADLRRAGDFFFFFLSRLWRGIRVRGFFWAVEKELKQ